MSKSKTIAKSKSSAKKSAHATEKNPTARKAKAEAAR